MFTRARKFIERIRGSQELHLNTDDYKVHPIKRETQENCERLQEEIYQLKSIIAKIREFIVLRPQLNALCEHYIADHPEGIVPVMKPQLEGLDPSNIYDYELMLKLRKNACADELEEMMLFIRRHSEIYLCFKEHEERAKIEWSTRAIRLLTY